VEASWSAAYAINSAGGVTGTAQLPGGAFRAFVATPDDEITLMGTLGGWSSYGRAIDSSGSVAGASSVVTGFLHAFLWANGEMRDLGTLAGGAHSGAYGMNDLGQIVGYSQIAGGESRATLWENGTILDLNSLIAIDTGWRLLEASAINSRGQIVGYGVWNGRQRAFRLDPIELPPPTAEEPPDTGPSEVPEPGAWALIVTGLAAIIIGRTRRRDAAVPATSTEADPNEWPPLYR
jgi:probable HAF family extracellular repeat protein